MKFKDADLIGFPLRIVVGSKGLANGQIEWSRRKDRQKQLGAPADVVAARSAADFAEWLGDRGYASVSTLPHPARVIGVYARSALPSKPAPVCLALWRVGAVMVGIEPHSHGLRNVARTATELADGGRTGVRLDGEHLAFVVRGSAGVDPADAVAPGQRRARELVHRAEYPARASGIDDNSACYPIHGDWRELQSSLWFHDHRFFFTAENVYKQHLVPVFHRQALQARRLGLVHPATGEQCEWEIPLADDFSKLLTGDGEGPTVRREHRAHGRSP